MLLVWKHHQSEEGTRELKKGEREKRGEGVKEKRREGG